MSLTVLFVARNLKVTVHQLLGGKVRNKIQVYAWIGGDRPKDIEVAAYVQYRVCPIVYYSINDLLEKLVSHRVLRASR
jgi:hypothetical protein